MKGGQQGGAAEGGEDPAMLDLRATIRVGDVPVTGGSLCRNR